MGSPEAGDPSLCADPGLTAQAELPCLKCHEVGSGQEVRVEYLGEMSIFHKNKDTSDRNLDNTNNGDCIALIHLSLWMWSLLW